MTRRNTFCILLLVLAATLAAPAYADQLSLRGCNTATPVTATSGSATLNCNVDYSVPGYYVTNGTSTETADLAAGTSGVFATLSNTPEMYWGGGFNSAYLTITYVFSNLSLENGTAQFNLTANGTLVPGIEGLTYMGFTYGDQFSVFSVNGVSMTGTEAFLPNGASNILLYAPIVNGTSQIQFTEFAAADCNGYGGSCTSSTDFFDPVTITGASAFDVNGNPVTGVAFVSESGFNPNASAVSTPEPTSLRLLLFGVLGLAILKLRFQLFPKITQ